MRLILDYHDLDHLVILRRDVVLLHHVAADFCNGISRAHAAEIINRRLSTVVHRARKNTSETHRRQRRRRRGLLLTGEKFPAFLLGVGFKGVKHRGAYQEVRERAHYQRQSPDILPLHLRRIVPASCDARVSPLGALRDKKFNDTALNEYSEICPDSKMPRGAPHLYGKGENAPRNALAARRA